MAPRHATALPGGHIHGQSRWTWIGSDSARSRFKITSSDVQCLLWNAFFLQFVSVYCCWTGLLKNKCNEPKMCDSQRLYWYDWINTNMRSWIFRSSEQSRSITSSDHHDSNVAQQSRWFGSGHQQLQANAVYCTVSFTDRFGNIPCSVDTIRLCPSLKEAQKLSKKFSPTFDGVRDLESQRRKLGDLQCRYANRSRKKNRVLFESLLNGSLKFVFVLISRLLVFTVSRKVP